MPVLSPSALPPSPPVTRTSSTPQLLPSPVVLMSKPAPQKCNANIPVVTLNSDSISDTMAARLSSALLHHVLFLKNQIPFPIAQLARLPSGRNPRATKKKEDLLDAVDTLTCHLLTTFSALSTALAQNTSRHSEINGVRPKARVDIAVVLGPSISGARARVLLSLDGLEVRNLGQRDYDQEEAETDDDDDDEEEEETEESEDEYSEQNEEDSQDGNAEDPASDDEQVDVDHPPRSPTPSDSSTDGGDSEFLQPPDPSVQRRRKPFSPRPSGVTQTEETQMLLAAERLLSRTLANACAEDDNGLGSEMAPTQTHILIRAPRRFVHPSWVPRQNLTTGLDTIYNDFLEHSGLYSPPQSLNGKKSKPRKSSVTTEGVWIRCDGLGDPGVQANNNDDDNDNEEDEMIWWSWDGKIVGFSDW